jgi:hypothetical protein
MAEIVYLLSALMSVACALMLWRGFRSNTGNRLLLWSSACFGLLALNCIFLFVDMVIFPNLNMQGPILRQFMGAGAGSILLFGLIWELT